MAYGSGSVYLRGKLWWISYPFRGKQVNESSKSQDRKTALSLLKKRNLQKVTGELDAMLEGKQPPPPPHPRDEDYVRLELLHGAMSILTAQNEVRDTYIYFAKAGKRIKIGISRSLSGRMATLQTASPDRIELLTIVRGNRWIESSLHAIFSRYRVNGEWFYFVPTIEEFVRRVEALAGDEA